ncbi:MAG: bifunctional hydroxymethylpyrimidine kinase/phosphomethylpyrimidine kinase [Nitrospinaceae bacterium]|nr:bifunctional hydroxymethylpyrimidine kinase/phosphomethylpyrimidine kinase [Nitrospinaceae bacterium]NIR57367.1 bifunctional hydroxymethylpyrimidine kinase/phosphomethylpyrimidine kinase [Nitrospinaceae bacterium]NIS84212.1 bifunctional hydroxymethylpyrimidine kinase/phosphomethylpyrimidine kinase [Nitrospinaceae bacterium]NIT81018.1 bifunctional hydroxymethylpyrimidine kinase/phosphomethylpyrimidine kinase [Nitrospinaceae bacterium]NIU46868.1 bifunctional hydroxymethylpyrimidine kinase/phos
MKQVPTVLTIAGSDSSGGAGIQADIKTISAHELQAATVITSVTSQNSTGVQAVFHLPPEQVEAQLNAVLEDGRPAAVKTGMLGNDELVECVARRLKRARVKNLVVDPVIKSSSRKTLLSKKGVAALMDKLLPLASLVTPNIPEAEILSGVRIKRPQDRLKAAKAIHKLGARHVLIKGGHAKGNADDFLFDGKQHHVFEGERIGKIDWHGTGCMLSAAIASNLALGLDVPLAVEKAKATVRLGIGLGIVTGEKTGNVNPLAELIDSQNSLEVLSDVAHAVEIFKALRIGKLIPEVQSNIAIGLPDARGPEDVAAIPGRISKIGDDIFTVAAPQFGASRHVAKIVLTAMSFDPEMRVVMNIKFTDLILKVCKQLKFKTASFDRAKEPKNVKQREGSSLEWGTYTAIQKCGSVPDIIYDLGGQGKEEMVRVLARDLAELVNKIDRIHQGVVAQLTGKEKDSFRVR